MRGRWLGAIVVVAALVALALQAEVVTRTGFLMGDFRAFYCAAAVASHGANPYHTQPLHDCEVAIGVNRFFENNPGVTIPAPLPGYAIAMLVPLSLLPFWVAAGLWAAVLLAAWAACVFALARFADVSWEVALAIWSLSLGAISLPFGEVVPVALACACMAAYFARQGRMRAAALLAGGAMLEPHLGLPVCLALALWKPATRVTLGLSLVALAALSVLLLGLPANVEYLTGVLPAHALSEINRDTQYSLSAVLAAAGVAPVAAVRAGMLWYILMIVAGMLAGGTLAKRTNNAAFIVCVPLAFAVFGGTFIHLTQLAAALPAAALLVSYTTGTRRALALVALLLLAVPWGWVVSPALLIAPLVPVGFLAWRYSNGNVSAGLVAAIAATAAVLGLGESYTLTATHFGAQFAAPFIDPRLPEASWSLYSRGGTHGTLAAWLVRIPSWSALALLLILVARESHARLRISGVALLAACCTILPLGAQLYGDRAGGWLMVDFRAYYCAALAQREGADPYYAQPLHECERATPPPYYRAPAAVTVPAPYPPYVLALLAPLTLLPFDAAAIVWWLLLAGAVVFAAWALAAIAAQPFVVAWAGFALSVGLATFSSGNLMPIGLVMLIAAALSVARGRIRLAVPFIALSMVEPQVALPAAIALFVAFPQIRLGLVAAAIALAGLSIAGGGFAQSVAYLTTVVPAHALSEVSRDNQYSLATVVAALGVPDASAALAGSVSYLLMAAIGVLAGPRLARRYGDPALILLVPTAFALLGGSFVHTAEIGAAVPAALLLYLRAGAYRGWLFAALVLLAVPWMMATSAAIFLAPLFPVAYLTYALWRRERAYALAAAVASFAALALLFAMAAHPTAVAHAVGNPHVYPPIDPRLAEASWRQFVLGNVTNRPIMWLLRLPTWIGLAALAVPALLLARKPRLALAVESA